MSMRFILSDEETQQQERAVNIHEEELCAMIDCCTSENLTRMELSAHKVIPKLSRRGVISTEKEGRF